MTHYLAISLHISCQPHFRCFRHFRPFLLLDFLRFSSFRGRRPPLPLLDGWLTGFIALRHADAFLSRCRRFRLFGCRYAAACCCRGISAPIDFHYAIDFRDSAIFSLLALAIDYFHDAIDLRH